MRSYRVWKTGTPAEMKIDELPDLVPGAGQVVINVEAAGIGFVDTLVASGHYQTIPPVPFAPGMEFSGRIRAIGPDVIGHAVGDPVAAYTMGGGFAEQAIARVGEFYPVPAGIAPDRAALLSGAYLTAHLALVERGQLQPGEVVLVGGAGGAVGLAAVQLAKALGAGMVLGAVRSDQDAQAVLAAGADAVIDLNHPDLKVRLRQQVHAVTGSRGVDLAIDPLGGDFLPAALRAMAWRGRLVVVGFAAGDIPSVKVNYLLLKNISVLGIEIGSYKRNLPDLVSIAQAQIFDLALSGRLQPRVAREFPFEAVPEALDLVAKGHTGGRVIVRIKKDRP